MQQNKRQLLTEVAEAEGLGAEDREEEVEVEVIVGQVEVVDHQVQGEDQMYHAPLLHRPQQVSRHYDLARRIKLLLQRQPSPPLLHLTPHLRHSSGRAVGAVVERP